LESLKETTRDAFDRVVVVHNVGVMGTSEYLNELSDINDWKEVYDINFFVPIILNTVIMNMFDDNTNTKKVIINISSLYGIKAGIGYGQYCSVKAAREMYFKVLHIYFLNVFCPHINSHKCHILATNMLFSHRSLLWKILMLTY